MFTTVQHGNWLKKHTIKRPFCTIFMLKNPYLKVQILQYNFFDWKCSPPPRKFSENSSVFVGNTSLTRVCVNSFVCTLLVDIWTNSICHAPVLSLISKPHCKTWIWSMMWYPRKVTPPRLFSSSNLLFGGKQMGWILACVTVLGNTGRWNRIRAISSYELERPVLYRSWIITFFARL